MKGFESMVMLSLLLFGVTMPILVLVEANGQAGTTLSASIVANVVNRFVYTWSIEKTANTTTICLSPSNQVAYVEYTVNVSKQGPERQYYLEGYVNVTNGGDKETENLRITIDVYIKGKKGWNTLIIDDYPVDVSSKPVIGPNETATYYFSIPIPTDYWSETGFKLTANVTITNHSGSLGQPSGPSPSDTTDGEPVVYIYVNNQVHVEDSNGYSWLFDETGQVTYVVAFNYNVSMRDYVHENTATIVETGQNSTWIVEVYQEIPSASVSVVSGKAFWDNNYNGVYDEGDSPIVNVQVDLYMWSDGQGTWVYIGSTRTDESGYYYFEVDNAGTYKVEVGEVSYECLVTPTTPTYYVVFVEELGSDHLDNDFGFVCLVQLTCAKSKGYWSWSQYNKKTGTWSTRVTNGDVSYINSALNTSFRSSLEVANFLTAPVLGDMKIALTQQLIATLLNLKYGYIDGRSVVYYNDRFQAISDIINKSIDSLNSGDRSEQEYYKTLLDYINNNNVLIVHPM